MTRHRLRAAPSRQTWGWGIDAGVSFNLPQFGAGDEITFTGAYTENAAWYSGLPDGMWGENGAVNGNGQQMALADTYFNPIGMAWRRRRFGRSRPSSPITSRRSSRSRSRAAMAKCVGPAPMRTSVVSNSKTWLAGVVAHWDPVKNLDFEFELLYQYCHTDQPNGFVPGDRIRPGSQYGDGFAARFEVTRSW